MTDNQQGISDADVALIDTAKLMLEILMCWMPESGPILDTQLAAREQHYQERGLVAAVAVVHSLRTYLNDPALAESRNKLRLVLGKPPAGTAE